MPDESLNILLLGAQGQLGAELSARLQDPRVQAGLNPQGLPLEITTWSRADFDFANLEELALRLEKRSPNIIFNASAYTAVDLAEDHEDEALNINAQLPALLAEHALQTQGVLVHYSTDFLFDGEKKTPYTEEDPPRPLSAYGRSKLAGEEAIERTGCQNRLAHGRAGSKLLKNHVATRR
jgi:dTDP-4-dehydrorhamnose reductase